MALRKFSTIFISILLALFFLSAAIAFPILNRELYFAEARRLELSKKTGYSEEVIREAYHDMMDYCTKGGERAGRTFRTGTLAFSESEKEHFDDVERLFHLDFLVLIISGAALVLILIFLLVKKNSVFSPWRFLGRGPLFWGPVGLFVFFGAVGIFAAMDFDQFFVTFHHLFFPGKENWIFDEKTDEIIRILPQEVFQYFGLIVLGGLLALSLASIAADLLIGKKLYASRQKKED